MPQVPTINSAGRQHRSLQHHFSSSGCSFQKRSRMMSQCTTVTSVTSFSRAGPPSLDTSFFTFVRMTTEPCSKRYGQRGNTRALPGSRTAWAA